MVVAVWGSSVVSPNIHDSVTTLHVWPAGLTKLPSAYRPGRSVSVPLTTGVGTAGASVGADVMGPEIVDAKVLTELKTLPSVPVLTMVLPREVTIGLAVVPPVVEPPAPQIDAKVCVLAILFA